MSLGVGRALDLRTRRRSQLILTDRRDFGDVAAVGVDRHDNVYVFARGEHPMTVFDRDGHFLRSWGEGAFKRPHGVHMGPDDTIYCTDDGDHTVRKYTLDGKLLLTIGTSGKPAPFMSGLPFHRCTHTALAPNGDIYVSDGYGNARVHRYAPDGKLIASWGEPGTGPGQFNIVHNICCDADGYVYVADRENHRIQVFDGNGKYETEWHDLYRPVRPVHVLRQSRRSASTSPSWRQVRSSATAIGRISDRASAFSVQSGQLLARLGDYGGPERPSPFIAPHGIAVDLSGAIYVAELSYAVSGKKLGADAGRDLVTLQKLCPLPEGP